MKELAACASGAHECRDVTTFDKDLVSRNTREHEKLAVRYHNLHITNHRDVAKRAIERIHADGAEHIPALVY